MGCISSCCIHDEHIIAVSNPIEVVSIKQIPGTPKEKCRIHDALKKEAERCYVLVECRKCDRRVIRGPLTNKLGKTYGCSRLWYSTHKHAKYDWQYNTDDISVLKDPLDQPRYWVKRVRGWNDPGYSYQIDQEQWVQAGGDVPNINKPKKLKKPVRVCGDGF